MLMLKKMRMLLLLLNFLSVLCLVASLLYNNVSAYAVVFLPVRIHMQS